MRDTGVAAKAGGLWEAAGNLVSMQSRAPQPAAAPRAGTLPLSPAQERLWFLCRHEALAAGYNVPLAWRICGRLDAGALQRALDTLVARHEILRTVFVDGPAAVVLEPAPLPVEQLTAASFEEGVTAANAIVRRPFNVARGPLCRAALVRIGRDEHLLVCVFHQIIFDGASMRVWSREMAECYRAFAAGAAPSLAPMPLQYADVVHWRQHLLAGDNLEAHAAYWRERMASLYRPLALTEPRNATEIGPGLKLPCEMSAGITRALTDLAAQEQTTLFSVLMAALQTWLWALTGQSDIIVFTSAADRGHPSLTGLIGLLANVLPIRTSLEGCASFREIVRRVRQSCVGAFAWQGMPLADILANLPHARGNVFQVMLIYQNTPLPTLEASGARFVPVTEIDTGAARFDLLLDLVNTRKTVAGSLKYRTDAFDAAGAAGFWDGFMQMLEAALADPDHFVPAVPTEAATPTLARREFLAPRDELETQLANWCADAFGTERVGVDESFFDMGGDSLAAVRMLRRIQKLTGVELSMSALVDSPTIEQLARVLRDKGYTGAHTNRLGGLRRLLSRSRM